MPFAFFFSVVSHVCASTVKKSFKKLLEDFMNKLKRICNKSQQKYLNWNLCLIWKFYFYLLSQIHCNLLLRSHCVHKLSFFFLIDKKLLQLKILKLIIKFAVTKFGFAKIGKNFEEFVFNDFRKESPRNIWELDFSF
jgi:hypothetical protein